MKLLVATNQLSDRAGSELHTVDLCRGFRRVGHQVVVFTLKLGLIADTLREEDFAIFSPSGLRSLSEEEFDLIYLHHATCEVFLGLVFAGKVPIVRGFLGIVPPLEKPIKGDFLSGKIYGSELVERTYANDNVDVPSLIARNVYDDQQLSFGATLREPPPGGPNFAVVSNHLDPALSNLLEAAAKEGLCRFTHFGLPDNSVPITAELLATFDAVVTIGRTVVLAAALGKPVYVCDVLGADGWLSRENFGGCQRNSFSGRLLGTKDWGLVRKQLLDTSRWPSLDDLAWLRERVRQDHSLSRRVEQLEAFFTEIIEKASPPVPPPSGYEGVLEFIEEVENTLHALKEVTARNEDLNRQLRDIKNSRTWRVLSKIKHLRATALGIRRRAE